MRTSKDMRIVALERELIAVKNYARDLKARHNKAITTLADLCAGYGIEVKGSAWHHSMKKLAKEELSEIAKMSLREVGL
jgi:hypothetical protein